MTRASVRIKGERMITARRNCVAPRVHPTVAMRNSPDEVVVIDAAALASVVGGYSPELFAQMKEAAARGLTVNSTWTGQHGSSPAGEAHYEGRAFDSIGTQDQMWSFYRHALTTKPHELIFHNKHMLNGKSVAPMGGHDTHVHYGW
jgi:hypothetical protein